ncbi:hypothetical protein B0H19DRAFT_1225864 [Mycena capillaripes]|nr:hypothetical protein B0H19DRAFT_1225864 [Mycena capillaripes]
MSQGHNILWGTTYVPRCKKILNASNAARRAVIKLYVVLALSHPSLVVSKDLRCGVSLGMQKWVGDERASMVLRGLFVASEHKAPDFKWGCRGYNNHYWWNVSEIVEERSAAHRNHKERPMPTVWHRGDIAAIALLAVGFEGWATRAWKLNQNLPTASDAMQCEMRNGANVLRRDRRLARPQIAYLPIAEPESRAGRYTTRPWMLRLCCLGLEGGGGRGSALMSIVRAVSTDSRGGSVEIIVSVGMQKEMNSGTKDSSKMKQVNYLNSRRASLAHLAGIFVTSEHEIPGFK